MLYVNFLLPDLGVPSCRRLSFSVGVSASPYIHSFYNQNSMRTSILSAAAFAASTLAAPQFAGAGFDPSALSGIGAAMGKMDFSGSTSNDLDNDPKCRPIYFIVARGSMEPGNVVSHHTPTKSGKGIPILTGIIGRHRRPPTLQRTPSKIQRPSRLSRNRSERLQCRHNRQHPTKGNSRPQHQNRRLDLRERGQEMPQLDLRDRRVQSGCRFDPQRSYSPVGCCQE